jgi:hypothetical protein
VELVASVNDLELVLAALAIVVGFLAVTYIASRED